MNYYLVRWRQYFFYYDDDVGRDRRLSQTHRLSKAFAKREAAERYIERVKTGEEQLPPNVNPFLIMRGVRRWDEFEIGYFPEGTMSATGNEFDGYEDEIMPRLESLTTLSEEELCEFVKSIGLQAPKIEKVKTKYDGIWKGRDWDRWWVETPMSEQQKRQVWDALDKLDFFEIVEVPLEM